MEHGEAPITFQVPLTNRSTLEPFPHHPQSLGKHQIYSQDGPDLVTASETYKSHSAFLSLTLEPKGLGFPSQGEGERSCIFFHHKNMILIFFSNKSLVTSLLRPMRLPYLSRPLGFWRRSKFLASQPPSAYPPKMGLAPHSEWDFLSVIC